MFFVRFRQRVTGPFDVERMRRMIAEGRVTPLHLVSADRQTWVSPDRFLADLAERDIPYAAPAPSIPPLLGTASAIGLAAASVADSGGTIPDATGSGFSGVAPDFIRMGGALAENALRKHVAPPPAAELAGAAADSTFVPPDLGIEAMAGDLDLGGDALADAGEAAAEGAEGIIEGLGEWLDGFFG